jgi:hypothetical protein
MDAELYFDIISLDIKLWGEVVSYEVGKTDLSNKYIYVCKRPGKLGRISKTLTTDDRNSRNLGNALEMALALFHFERAGNKLTGYLPQLLSALGRLFSSEEELDAIRKTHQQLQDRYLGISDEDSESNWSEDEDWDPTQRSAITAEFKHFMCRFFPQFVTQNLHFSLIS